MAKSNLAKFYRMRADQYRSLLTSEDHPALKLRWLARMRQCITKAQKLEMEI